MFIDGVLGTLCLIITTCQGQGLHRLDGAGIGLLLLAAFFAFTGIVLAYKAISIGIAGVVLSIYNANAALLLLLSVIFLHQLISNA